VILVSSSYYKIGMRIPSLRALMERQLINRIAELLDSYGHADCITDAAQYQLAPAE
jgi:ribosomal protein L16 Arg81 hydroxylase